MAERKWLHIGGIVGTLAVPVEVLSGGPKRLHVRVCHTYRRNKRWVERGTTLYVPTYAVGHNPNRDALVSKGGGGFGRHG